MPRCIPAPNADDHGPGPRIPHSYAGAHRYKCTTHSHICTLTMMHTSTSMAYRHTHALHVHTIHVHVHTRTPACLIPSLRTHVYTCTLHPSPMHTLCTPNLLRSTYLCTQASTTQGSAPHQTLSCLPCSVPPTASIRANEWAHGRHWVGMRVVMWVGTWPFCGASLGSYLGFEDFSPIRSRFQGWLHPTTLHRMVWLVCLLTEE